MMYYHRYMKIKAIPAAILLSLVAFTSCGKLESLPPDPNIDYTSFTVFDTLDQLGNQVRSGRLKFYFEDGDGDVGLNAPEGEEVSDTINLFIELFRIEGGISSPAPETDPYRVKGFRIPYMERVGRNKILRGDISVDFSYYEISAEDSIIYDFYIRDRKGNISNTESTSVIPVFYPGIYAE